MKTVSEQENETVQLKGINNLSVIGQLNNSFILAQNAEGLYIIDQHTCHERILYEKFMKAEAQKGNDFPTIVNSCNGDIVGPARQRSDAKYFYLAGTRVCFRKFRRSLLFAAQLAIRIKRFTQCGRILF